MTRKTLHKGTGFYRVLVNGEVVPEVNKVSIGRIMTWGYQRGSDKDCEIQELHPDGTWKAL